MNRKFMSIFSQISPTFLLFTAYLFIKIRRLFYESKTASYTRLKYLGYLSIIAG